MKLNWSRTEIIGISTLAIAFMGVVAAWAVVPEFRQVFLTPAGNRQVANINSPSDPRENKKNEGFGKVFDSQDPYPIGFEKAQLGSHVSVLQIVYPNGELSSNGYVFTPQDGPFDFVLFQFSGNEDDPVVRTIAFHLKDSGAREYVREQAVNAFGTDKVK